MTIDELIALLNNRLTFNAGQRAAAALRGDLAAVTLFDEDTATTTATLAILTS
jgi:hypothetical protein